MSLFARLDDAQVLYEQGRLHGALLSLLVALAATSRKRYPSMRDGDAFRTFLGTEMRNLTGSVCNVAMPGFGIDLRGEPRTLEDILYRFVRCELAHEGTMPGDIVFVRHETMLLYLAEHALELNVVFLQGLANVVLRAPENAGELTADATRDRN